ncbi:hypothetical protein N0V90_000675 [Kalmusia sp. IMI 367209]|nr:hypothetical protein N0V90_000675 [Kalmusia sp. IMI 367209]
MASRTLGYWMLLLILSAQLISAANNLIFKNKCDHSLYYWVIHPDTVENDNLYIVVPAHDERLHVMESNGAGGIAIKFRDLPVYTVAPAGILQAEYNLEPATNRFCPVPTPTTTFITVTKALTSTIIGRTEE